MDIAGLGLYICLFIALYFEVFLLISFFEKKPLTKTSVRPKHYPSVTMLVPAYNEAGTLAQTVESLLSLDYPKDKLKVLIVDDGSRDSTRNIGQALAAQHETRVGYLYKENGGKYTALNLGIQRSNSELVGCLDADSFVAKDALLEVVKKLEADPSIMALTPVMKVHRPKKVLELMQAVEYTFGIFYKKMFDNLAAVNVLPGPFSIYKREVFKKIGLFKHAHNTEDMEIAFRMHAHGLKIVNAHTAVVYTTVPTTLRSLLKQRTRWSQGFLQNSQDYKYMFFNPRFGHLGMLVLPFALVAFFSGLYMALYATYQLSQYTILRTLAMWQTGIPPHLGTSDFTWYYLNTSMLTLLVVIALTMTLAAILLGARIGGTRLPLKSFAYYFALYGFIAPLWLARALWGAALAKQSAWR